MYRNIKRLLDERGITPYRLSKDTGIAQSCLSDWKSGKSKPKVDKLEKIAEYFGVPIQELLKE